MQKKNKLLKKIASLLPLRAKQKYTIRNNDAHVEMSSPHKGLSSVDTGADSGIQIIQRRSPSVIPEWVLINVVSFKYHAPVYSWFSLASRLYDMLACNMAKK